MRAINGLFLFLLFISAACATETNTLFVSEVKNCVVSDQQSNMVVFFEGPHMNDADLDADKPFHFGFQSTTNTYYQLFILRPEFGCRISATGEDGNILELTSTGAEYGERFGEVKGLEEQILDTTPGYGHTVPSWAYATPLPGATRSLPAPDKLFKFKQPGRYTMSIEVECLYRAAPLPGESYRTNLYLVRFPPVKLRVGVGS